MEQWTLGLTSGGDFFAVKGVVESLVATIAPTAALEVAETRQSLLDESHCCTLQLNGTPFGYLGEVEPEGLKQFGLRSPTTVAEISLDVLARAAELTREFTELSPYPSIARDLNLIVDESLRWGTLATTVRRAAGEMLEQLAYQETYRDPQKDGMARSGCCSPSRCGRPTGR